MRTSTWSSAAVLILLLAGCASSTGGGGASLVTLPSDVHVDCRQISTTALHPYGSLPDPRAWEPVSLTEFSSCYFSLDTNSDGVVNAWDELSDSVHIRGGLLEQIDGNQADLSILDDSRLWGSSCDGEVVDVPLVEGFTRSAGCSENGQLTGNFQLLIGRTDEGVVATLSCGVTATPKAPLDGREDAVESMCSTAYGQLFGFGAD